MTNGKLSTTPGTYSASKKRQPLTERIRERLVFIGSDGKIKFSFTLWLLLSFCFTLLLVPLLFFPLGPDNALFYVAGQKIVHQGAIHYRDIVDVKPPLIYYINAFAIAILGDNPFSIRLLDLIAQLATSLLLVLLIRSTTGRILSGILSAILYIFLYLGLSYINVTQVESFVGLFMLPAVWLFLQRRNLVGYGGIGTLCGFAILLKFTFGILIVAFLIGDLLLYNDSWRTRIKHWGSLIFGSGIVMALFVAYLFFFDAWSGFLDMQVFLTGYSGNQWTSIRNTIRLLLQNLPALLTDEYSLAMTLGTAWGIVLAASGNFRSKLPNSSQNSHDASSALPVRTDILLLRICTVLLTFLTLTVIIEGKWFAYHILRIFPFGVILASFGLISAVRLLLKNSKEKFAFIIFPLVAFLLIALSPFSRYLFHAGSTLAMLSSGEKSFDDYYHSPQADGAWSMQEIKEIGAYLQAERKEGETLFISSGIAGMVYMACGYVPEFHILHSCFLIAPFAPDIWRDTTRTFLIKEHPTFIVLQDIDKISTITGTEETSVDVFKRMPDLWSMLENDYTIALKTHTFTVYRRTEEIIH